ncbi:MAG TPA: hypothetical protein DCZ91_03910 [Lachnospiraceae bacterium]|nr:hypothetical protein [Lachnospiraceae bacterium]
MSVWKNALIEKGITKNQVFLLYPDLSVLDTVYLTFSRRLSMRIPLFIWGFPHNKEMYDFFAHFLA